MADDRKAEELGGEGSLIDRLAKKRKAEQDRLNQITGQGETPDVKHGSVTDEAEDEKRKQ